MSKMLIQNRFLNDLFFITIAEFLFLTANPPEFIYNLHQDLLEFVIPKKQKKMHSKGRIAAVSGTQLMMNSRRCKKETKAKKTRK